MANVVVNKILDFLGVDNSEVEDDEELLDNESYGYDQMEEEVEEDKRGIFNNRKGNKVVNMPQQHLNKQKIYVYY